ncbi:MAG: pre-peptidase C-terminal domain-containing protein [Anaerolineae bacterium]
MPQSSQEVVEGTVNSNDVYTYPFSAQAGDVFTITAVATSGDLDPRIAVYYDNNYVADNDDYGTTDPNMQSTDARIYNLIATDGGQYEIDVRGYRETSGDFRMTIERVATGAPTGLPTEQVELGTIRSGETYDLDFEAQAGDWVTISVRGLTHNFDAYLALLNSDGTVLLDNDDNGSAFLGELGFLDAQITNYHITESGTYTVEVTGVGGVGGSFGVTISTLR